MGDRGTDVGGTAGRDGGPGAVDGRGGGRGSRPADGADRQGGLRVAAGARVELVGDALREIRAHPLRSFLTLSGIVFGTAALVSMTSLAAGMKLMAYDELRRMGMERTVEFVDRAPPPEAERAAELRHPGLRRRDVGALGGVEGVEAVYGQAYAGALVVGTGRDQRQVPVDGVDAGYLRYRNWPVVRGRGLAPLDILNASRVAVVGEELVEPLFGGTDPVGRSMRIDGVRFRVVGVVAPVQLEMVPADFSFTARRVYVPYTYVSRYHSGGDRVGSVAVQARRDADFAATLRRAELLLERRHLGARDFEVDNEAAEVAENLVLADGILSGWNVVMYAIAGITLVIGGVGLFSVLLISVRERVREIGIRKAVGADDRDVLRLFLVESLTLAMLGAGLGVGAGVGLIQVTRAIAGSFGRDFTLPLHGPGVAAAVAFSLLVGLAFGWYPSRRAARLDPIEAIRRE